MTFHIGDVEMGHGGHLYCVTCQAVPADDRAPDTDCFDDGCEYECCGCGGCIAPLSCGSTGKGYVWHQ